MLGAFMLFAISMKANSTTTVGTSADISYETNLSDVEIQATFTSFANGRRAGRRVGAAVGRVAFIATLAYQVATDYFGGGGPSEEILNFAGTENLSKFDL